LDAPQAVAARVAMTMPAGVASSRLKEVAYNPFAEKGCHEANDFYNDDCMTHTTNIFSAPSSVIVYVHTTAVACYHADFTWIFLDLGFIELCTWLHVHKTHTFLGKLVVIVKFVKTGPGEARE
jgi:hypothetical protein